MDPSVVQDNLRNILLVSGTGIGALVTLFLIYKKFRKPTVRSARRNLKRLVLFLNNLEGAHNGVGTESYTLEEVSKLIVDQDVIWKGDR